MNILIIGCGGTGAALARMLTKQYPDHQLTGMDPDIVEKKNLARQEFYPEDIDTMKTEALVKRGLLKNHLIMDPLFTRSFKNNTRTDIGMAFCCADTLFARREVIEWADLNDRPIIITGNEVYVAEAYIYLPVWKKTRRDPRKYYPSLMSSDAQESCADSANVQTVMANNAAATFAVYLFDLWSEIDWANDKRRIHHLRIDKNEAKGTR